MMFVAQVTELHEQAMALSEQGLLARLDGDSEKAKMLLHQAFEFESSAANLVASTAIEPSRSVLHHSAATLALNCGELRAAERLIAVGLAVPPPEALCHLFLYVFEQLRIMNYVALCSHRKHYMQRKDNSELHNPLDFGILLKIFA